MKKLYLCALLVSVLVTLGGCHGDNSKSSDDTEDPDSQSKCDGDCFPNGVAAGDVDQSSVVLWARSPFTGTVRFEYGRDPDFVLPPDGVEDVVVEDPEPPNEHHIPAKVDISGLLAGTQYYYRVCRDSCSSAVPQGSAREIAQETETEAQGSFRTPYADGKHGLRFGVSSCFRGDMKPFVSIKNVPNPDPDDPDVKLDFFVALGDTVYADSPPSGGRAKTREEFIEKYQLAYSQSYSPDDNMFAKARASTAFFAGIDDHEIIDNFAGGAAPESQTDTTQCKKVQLGVPAFGICFCDPDNDPNGDCAKDYINETTLFEDALWAWHKYNPVREEQYGDTRDARTDFKRKLYRYRTFGKDAAMFLLDARSFRSEPDLGATWDELDNRDQRRTMLGRKQLNDLLNNLQSAEDNGITWKFVMVPEPIQNFIQLASAADRFEGYNYERSIILDFIETNGIANVVFISGDIHATVVNNLTYRNSQFKPERYSASWDISTGPAAYSAPGNNIFSLPPGPLGTAVTRSDPIDQTLIDSERRAKRDELDEDFKDFLDFQIVDHPDTGLGVEAIPTAPLQKRNAIIPVESMTGTYVAGHSYGWTEFEVEAATQKLIVTTHGIDWYDSTDVSVLSPVNTKEYSEDEVTALLDRDPYILHQFKVLPRDGSARCGDQICESDFTKNILYGPETCAPFDNEALNQCHTDCGICKACEAGGSTCIFGTSCCSGRCDSAFCKAVSCRSSGASCTHDWECCSGGFNACSGFIGNKTCK